MQLVKRIITVLFSAQLFITAALCGGACCGDSAAAAAPETISHQTESGHCHTKPSSPKPSTKISASHPACHSAKSAPVIDSHRCACSIEREEQGNSAAIAASSTIGRDWQQEVAGSPSTPCWLEAASPPQEISPHALCPHSPPHTGFQLSLRI